MKKMVKNLMAIIAYMILLCVLLKADIVLIFSPKHIGMFLLGEILLCIPYFEKGIGRTELKSIFKRNAVMAGCLETFMLLYVSLMQKGIELEGVLPALALDLRPLFYGFVCCMALREEPEILETKEKGALGGKEKSVPEAEEETRKKGELDFSKLTRQEKTVAELAGRGLSNREIGEELCISETTVKKHLSNIFEKLEISSRKELRN